MTDSFTIPSDEIISQMEKICRSSELSSKLQLCRLLRYLVGETLAGREENLKGFNLGVEVFKRDPGFSPETDPIVRIHAGRLRRMLKMYYLDSGRGDKVKIEIPKGNYIPRFSYKEHSLADLHKNHWHHQSHRIEPSVAIMPFRNLTGDPEKDYFVRGFSEELLVEMTKYEDLVVYDCRPSSSIIYSHADGYEFIKGRGIRFVLDGSVQYDMNRVKVLVRLTDAQDGEQIWAQRYLQDLTANSMNEIQESIAREISGILGAEYGVIPQKLTSDSNQAMAKTMDTYTALLRFYYFEAHQTPESAGQAFNALEEALQKEPGSAIATALMAIMHGNRYALDYPEAEKSFKIMGELAEKAIKLDPNSLTINVALAFKCFMYDEKDRFFRIAESCLSSNPNRSLRLGSLGFHMSLYGDWERGMKLLDMVMVSRIGYPLYLHGAMALYHYRRNDYEKALEEANKYNVPSLFWGPLLRIAALGQLKRIPEAEPNIQLLKRLKPDFVEKARYLISRFVKEDRLVEHVMEGLAKAGLLKLSN